MSATSADHPSGSTTASDAVQRAGEAVSDAAARVKDGDAVGWAARAGLTARGIVYLLLGVLVISIALGDTATNADQKGALAELIERPFGGLAVGLLAIGFACYAAWRLSEVFTGVKGTGGRAWPRVQSAFRAGVYAFLTWTAVSVLLGSTQSQASQQSTTAATVMTTSAGRAVIGLVGAAVIVVGLSLAWEGLTLKFMRWFPSGQLQPHEVAVVKHLGRVGTVARGLVFAVAGWLLLLAAWTYDPSKATGIDGAVHVLRTQPYGVPLLLAAGAGLIAFGVFGLAEARYRRV